MDYYQKLLNELASKTIGDGGSPNIFFITEGVGADTLAVIVGEHHEEQAIELARTFPGPIVVEDRENGVCWENETSLRICEKNRIQEEGKI